VKRPAVDPNTALALVGLAALAFGIGLVFLPAAFVVVGGLLLVYSILPDQTPGGPTP
jgi:hypothetical protein